MDKQEKDILRQAAKIIVKESIIDWQGVLSLMDKEDTELGISNTVVSIRPTAYCCMMTIETSINILIPNKPSKKNGKQ